MKQDLVYEQGSNISKKALAFVAASILQEHGREDLALDTLQAKVIGAGLGVYAVISLLSSAGGNKNGLRPCDVLPDCFTHASQHTMDELLASLYVVSRYGRRKIDV